MSYYNYNGAANGPAANAAYLLGMGPLPPVDGRLQAVAQMQAALDSGMFDGMQRQPPQFEEDQDEDDDEDDEDNTIFAAPAELDQTLICIAHQLGTIISYDRILVLDAGNVVQFDSPLKLFNQEGGVFRGLGSAKIVVPFSKGGDIVVRQFQPQDALQLHALLVEASSMAVTECPCNAALRAFLFRPVSFVAYGRLLLGLALLTRPNNVLRTAGIALSLGAVALFLYIRCSITRGFLDICTHARETDMADISSTYGVNSDP
ncbi:hypothetical protein C8J57DRAFT_1529689 [Mycena rebaudengoi]|nr:hypothetical protein C8J57DRAFT_1529689 [Mycena rebaudengoi]